MVVTAVTELMNEKGDTCISTKITKEGLTKRLNAKECHHGLSARDEMALYLDKMMHRNRKDCTGEIQQPNTCWSGESLLVNIGQRVNEN